jgi:hypothetical protein
VLNACLGLFWFRFVRGGEAPEFIQQVLLQGRHVVSSKQFGLISFPATTVKTWLHQTIAAYCKCSL